MDFVGTWHVVGMADRELVFFSDGTGRFTEHGPFFRWWPNETGRLTWQFFLDAGHTQIASRIFEPDYEASPQGDELRFAHAPFPFGIKHFRRSTEA